MQNSLFVKKTEPKRWTDSAKIYIARKMSNLYPPSTFVTVLGTVGKSSTIIFCEAILSSNFETISTSDNTDKLSEVVSTLLKLRPKIKKVLLEVDIQTKEESDLYLTLLKPGVVIVPRLTNSKLFLDFYIKQLSQLSKDSLAILNWDDLEVRKLADFVMADKLFFGTDSKNCHLWADKIRLENSLTVFELNYGVERVEIKLPFIGRHFITSALAAAGLGISIGMSLFNIKKKLEAVDSKDCPIKIWEGVGGFLVLDDSNHLSQSSLEEALRLVNEVPSRRRFLILSELKELGASAEDIHRKIGQTIFKDKLDYVFLTGGDTKFIADELINLGFLTDRLEYNLSHSQIVSQVLNHAQKGDVILVKGPKIARFDEVVNRIIKPER